MSSENDLLLQRISQLAGQINRHKNQSDPASAPVSHPTYYRGASRGRGYYRGATPYSRPGRGGRGAYAAAPVHRNRTLVLNSKAPGGDASSEPAVVGSGQPSAGLDSTKWISKRDRHMQLINPSVYGQQIEARSKAMEETRKEKLRRKAEAEKKKFYSYLQVRNASSPARASVSAPSQDSSSYEVSVDGLMFRVAKGGRKLIRTSDPRQGATPQKALVGGVTFIRSTNGNMWRAGYVSLKRVSKPTPRLERRCKYFTMHGKCNRGNTCPFTHDPLKVAICPQFMQNKCMEGDACDLSHDPTPHRVPACTHFLRGNCTNADCRYAHIRVSPSAPVCKDFAIEGYCDKGPDCTERHVHECPEFDEKGVCSNTNCKLQHVERAGRRRAAAVAAKNSNSDGPAGDAMEDIDDVSSEDEDAAIDDVDSDSYSEEEEEYLGSSDQTTGREVSEQMDYIHF